MLTRNRDKTSAFDAEKQHGSGRDACSLTAGKPDVKLGSAWLDAALGYEQSATLTE
jgi:hypothetical protein